MNRSVFFISDGTGITAESFGQSLLAQFEHVDFNYKTIPYVDTPERAREIVDEINKIARIEHHKPIIFSTIVEKSLATMVSQCEGFVLDIFTTFVPRLEGELDVHSSHNIGKVRSIDNNAHYFERIDAVHFALDSDDGARTRFYNQADIILTGVSRCGKTPTCLYLALQFGIRAANYPLTDDDLELDRLPAALRPFKPKLFGLTIDPDRLVKIREERKPNSHYASPRQCARELKDAESLIGREGIPIINTTHFSVEEIATRILAQSGIERRLK